MIFSRDKVQKDLQNLVGLCRKNDKRAQLALYNQYAKAMYNVCLNITHKPSDAEEIMHDGFISAFQHINSYKGEVSFGAWLKKIMVNKSVDFLRKRVVTFDELNENINQAEVSGPEESEFNTIQANQIKIEIAKLPEGYRTIVSLYLFEGYDHEEIAQILNISASTSRSQYARAKSLILKNLENKKENGFIAK
ncbi:MAG: sigma-70 family RNA polymerase sigma factor [Bacteroidales bacterium]|nr:sigma-70 family RNA polymerase sigma factor [Bacteroidales bacterium]MBN2817440.1 sigma-70 family RNA polymerase sigma factor [Bacteroidales bacterium]